MTDIVNLMQAFDEVFGHRGWTDMLKDHPDWFYEPPVEDYDFDGFEADRAADR